LPSTIYCGNFLASMNKLGYQPLTVLMQSESSGFGWALTPGRSSPTVIALRILIVLCAVLPICVIGVASFTARTSGTKHSMPALVSPKSNATSAPAANEDGGATVLESDTNRTHAVAVADKSPPVDQAPTPVSTTPSEAEASVDDNPSNEKTPRVTAHRKLEKLRHRVERRRLEQLYQKHAPRTSRNHNPAFSNVREAHPAEPLSPHGSRTFRARQAPEG
jgi:hypothetical protein